MSAFSVTFHDEFSKDDIQAEAFVDDDGDAVVNVDIGLTELRLRFTSPARAARLADVINDALKQAGLRMSYEDAREGAER